MPCKPGDLRKAAILAVFGAVRASMRRMHEARRVFELLALRLDLLASIGVPVDTDPRLSSLLTRLSVQELDGLEWIYSSLCELLEECGGRFCRGK